MFAGAFQYIKIYILQFALMFQRHSTIFWGVWIGVRKSPPIRAILLAKSKNPPLSSFKSESALLLWYSYTSWVMVIFQEVSNYCCFFYIRLSYSVMWNVDNAIHLGKSGQNAKTPTKIRDPNFVGNSETTGRVRNPGQNSHLICEPPHFRNPPNLSLSLQSVRFFKA